MGSTVLAGCSFSLSLPCKLRHLLRFKYTKPLLPPTTRFGKLALIPLHDGVPPPLGLLPRRRIAQIHDQGLELRPRQSGNFLLEVLPLVKPIANPQRLGPHRLNGFGQAERPIRGNGHRRLQPPRERDRVRGQEEQAYLLI